VHLPDRVRGMHFFLVGSGGWGGSGSQSQPPLSRKRNTTQWRRAQLSRKWNTNLWW